MPSTKLDKTPHDHDFKTKKDNVRECYCGYAKMSREVFQERRKAWQHYYSEVWEKSTAARRFRAQVKAFNEHKWDLVKGFSEKASEQIKNGAWEVKTPDFADPMELDVKRKLWID